jgi:DNA-binding MarR family transcriptional regulator
MKAIKQPSHDLSDEVLIAIRRVIRAVDLHSKKLSQDYHLTGPQALVLREIMVNQEVTPGELARRVSLSQATITDIIKRLEARGYVTRVPGQLDRRQVILEITAAGRQLVNTAPPLLQDQFTRRFNQLEGWEQMQLLSSLQRVAALMDAEDIEAAPLLTGGSSQ